MDMLVLLIPAAFLGASGYAIYKTGCKIKELEKQIKRLERSLEDSALALDRQRRSK